MDEDAWWERFAPWPLRDRLQLLAFEAELMRLPRYYIATLREAVNRLAKD